MNFLSEQNEKKMYSFDNLKHETIQLSFIVIQEAKCIRLLLFASKNLTQSLQNCQSTYDTSTELTWYK